MRTARILRIMFEVECASVHITKMTRYRRFDGATSPLRERRRDITRGLHCALRLFASPEFLALLPVVTVLPVLPLALCIAIKHFFAATAAFGRFWSLTKSTNSPPRRHLIRRIIFIVIQQFHRRGVPEQLRLDGDAHFVSFGSVQSIECDPQSLDSSAKR